MKTERLLLAVVSGTVLVAGSWGDTPVAAGEKKSFLEEGAGGENVRGQVNILPDLWLVAGESLKFDKFIRCLAVANLLPDFALDKEQKTQVARIRAGINEEWKVVAEKIRAGGSGASPRQVVPQAKQYVAKIMAVLTPAQRKILDMPYAVADPDLLPGAQRRLSPAQLKALDEFVDPFDPPCGDQNDIIKFSGLLCDTAMLNLSPDFTLEKSQKTQIQEIWHTWKAALDKYEESVKNRIQAISKEKTTPSTMDQIHKICSAGPKSDDSVSKLRAVLTPEQLKAVDNNRSGLAGSQGTGSVKFMKAPQ